MLKTFILLFLLGVGIYYLNTQIQQPSQIIAPQATTQIEQTQSPQHFETTKPVLPSPPIQKILSNNYHIFQSYNNCGPAALSMALSYYGRNISQAELGKQLRPYQIPGGDNDDKSVTLKELAEKSKQLGFVPYHRPNGNLNLIRQFIANDMPVITRTWLKENEDIGHYRVVKGYNESQILQDDSLQGKNLWYEEADFNAVWKKFNYEYLVLVPDDKIEIAEQILEQDLDDKIAWQKAVELSRLQLKDNPQDMYARFNLSVALYEVGDYKASVDEFEKVENQLPFRTLWYQLEPVLAYKKLGNNQRVLQIADKILNYHNRAYSELYQLKGEIYKEQGKIDLAEEEFEKAKFYNQSESYMVNLR